MDKSACEIIREDLRRISKASKLADFDQKAWAIAQGFSTCRISVSVGNPSKLPETPLMRFQMDFQLLSRMLVKISDEFRRVRNRLILTKKPGL